MKNIVNYIIARSRERSTWIGIVSIIAAAGMALTPEQTEAIASAGVAIAGLIAIFTKDQGSNK